MAVKPERTPQRDERTGRAAAAQRMQRQHEWVDQQIRVAMERGDFDNLPGAGKPIKDLGTEHDPDWWLKRLIEREHISGVLPPALQLRKDDAELDAQLDRHTADNGLVLEDRFATWDRQPWIEGGDYAVSVHRRQR